MRSKPFNNIPTTGIHKIQPTPFAYSTLRLYEDIFSFDFVSSITFTVIIIDSINTYNNTIVLGIKIPDSRF